MKTDNLLESCRICMAQDAAMNPLFEGVPDSVSDRIMYCTGVQFIDETTMPSKICESCLNNLNTSYQFKASCLIADDTFRQMLTSSVKIEISDSDGMDDDTFSDYEDKVKVELDVLDMLRDDNITVKLGKKKRIKYKKTLPTKKVKAKLKEKNTDTKSNNTCDLCNIEFKTRSEYVKHKKDEHQEAEYWVCEICGKQFYNRSSHYSHLKTHQPPRHTCDHCDYATTFKYDLVKHVRIHTGMKIYQCEYCSLSYHNSSNLTSHKRRSHTGERRFKCPQCDKGFFDRTKLNRHVDSHNDIKRHPCEICHTSFTRRCYWKKHLFRHHGVTLPKLRPGRPKASLCVDPKSVSLFPGDTAKTEADEAQV